MDLLAEGYRTDCRQLLTEQSHPIAKGLSCFATLQSLLLGSFLHCDSNYRLERKSFSYVSGDTTDWNGTTWLALCAVCCCCHPCTAVHLSLLSFIRPCSPGAPKEMHVGEVVGWEMLSCNIDVGFKMSNFTGEVLDLGVMNRGVLVI